MLLPPKSLRSRFGDSERFNPLQREGDRFTADGEEEGEKRQGAAGGEKGEGMEGGRERKVLFTEVPRNYQAEGALGWRGSLPFPPGSRKELLVSVEQMLHPVTSPREELGQQADVAHSLFWLRVQIRCKRTANG